MTTVWIITLYLCSGWLIGLAMALVLARRLPVTKAWMWLAIIFGIPWLGLALYLLLGENPLGRRRVVLYRQVMRQYLPEGGAAVLGPTAQRTALGSEDLQLERLAQANGALPAVEGNAATLLADHEQILTALIDDIDAAQRHVHMVFYIFHDDETGRAVAAALIRAAERGVRCRLLGDAVGSGPMLDRLAPPMQRAGVHVEAALPVNPLRGRLSRIDVRNHRKIVVIDGHLSYIGSWNVSNPDYGDPKLQAYRDVSVRLAGPVSLQLQALFLEDWSVAVDGPISDGDLFAEPQQAGTLTFQALPSGPLYPTSAVRDVAVEAIHQARERIVLTTPYFVPDESLLLALRLAGQRGVRVDVVVPRRSDLRVVDAAARAYLRELIGSGVNAYFHRHGVLHAKTLTVDRRLAIVGSANYDIRSFQLNIESNMLAYSPAFVEQLCELQQLYIHNSLQWGPDRARADHWTARVHEDLAKLLSPLI